MEKEHPLNMYLLLGGGEKTEQSKLHNRALLSGQLTGLSTLGPLKQETHYNYAFLLS